MTKAGFREGGGDNKEVAVAGQHDMVPFRHRQQLSIWRMPGEGDTRQWHTDQVKLWPCPRQQERSSGAKIEVDIYLFCVLSNWLDLKSVPTSKCSAAENWKLEAGDFSPRSPEAVEMSRTLLEYFHVCQERGERVSWHHHRHRWYLTSKNDLHAEQFCMCPHLNPHHYLKLHRLSSAAVALQSGWWGGD